VARSGTPSHDPSDVQSLPLDALKAKLAVSPDAGLTKAEADKRLSQYGPNEIAEKTVNPILKFLSYFWGPIPWMIEAAALLSALVHHWSDFVIILMLLFANAVVGFWEEYQAGNAIAALKAKLAVYGLLMPAIGWELAALVWGYALVWFLINDRVKLLGYRIFDPSGEPALIAQRGPATAAGA
jgi:hypothetical protein